MRNIYQKHLGTSDKTSSSRWPFSGPCLVWWHKTLLSVCGGAVMGDRGKGEAQFTMGAILYCSGFVWKLTIDSPEVLHMRPPDKASPCHHCLLNMFLNVCVCAWACVWRPKDSLSCCFLDVTPTLLFLDRISHWSGTHHVGWADREPQGPSCLCLLRAQSCLAQCWGPNLCPHAFIQALYL